MSGRLTTHVLDVSRGIPAQGMSIALFRWLEPSGEKELIKKVTTNRDGRVDEVLLEGGMFRLGLYELLFEAGDYYRSLTSMEEQDIIFDQIPIRFRITDELAHYHIPLLMAPGGYSTYRGS